MKTSFTCPKEAAAFGLALRGRGITCQVRVIPATPAVMRDFPDSAAAEAEILLFAERGEELGSRALAWAKASPWWKGDDSLHHTVACLECDLEEGHSNGAASRAQAGLFIKRLNAALHRAPKVSREVSPAQPANWDIVWDEPEVESGHARDAEHENEAWGTSVGSDGWMCD